MIHLRFDINRHAYVDDAGQRVIPLEKVTFCGDQQRFHPISGVDLESHVEALVCIPKERDGILSGKGGKFLLPNAYALARFSSFYTVDYLFIPEEIFASSQISEEVAK